MYLKQMKTRSGRVRLAIYESYWDGGKSHNRVVLPLGFLDELASQHADPVSWGKALAAQMTEEKKAAEASVEVTIHPKERIDKRAENLKNLGCACVLSVYGGLKIEQALRSLSRSWHDDYDVNAVARLLVVERIIEPGSKKAAWQNRDRYFFRTDFSDDDIYRALDRLAAAKDAIIAAMNKSIAASGTRDLSCVYYDVTNYYFECDEEDDLRKKGVSKEHRKNPIVQMGLLQDSNGIPIAYRKFPGNTSDCTTMIPVLSDMKRDCKIDRVVVVADKGCNTSDNIAAAVAGGDGFVFSQSVRATKSDSELKAWVLSDEGYRTYHREGEVDGGNFKIKSAQGFKTVHIKAADTASGKPEDVVIDVKYVAFWSRKYAVRAQLKRAKALEKARDLICHPGAYTRATSHGAAKYVKNLQFDKKTGEILEGDRALLLDDAVIAEEEALDGYYLIVTSETGWSDERILDAYRELWRIEESFKVTKSELSARPIFVWTPAHIEAHFLICYMALTILRLLERATGLHPSIIRREIAAMNCINVDANWWVCGHRSDESDVLIEALGLEELKLKNLKTKDIRAMLAKAKRVGLPQAK